MLTGASRDQGRAGRSSRWQDSRIGKNENEVRWGQVGSDRGCVLDRVKARMMLYSVE